MTWILPSRMRQKSPGWHEAFFFFSANGNPNLKLYMNLPTFASWGFNPEGWRDGMMEIIFSPFTNLEPKFLREPSDDVKDCKGAYTDLLSVVSSIDKSATRFYPDSAEPAERILDTAFLRRSVVKVECVCGFDSYVEFRNPRCVADLFWRPPGSPLPT